MSFADITPDQWHLRGRYHAWDSSQKPTYGDFENKYTQWLSKLPTNPDSTQTTESLVKRFFKDVYLQPKADPVQLQTPPPVRLISRNDGLLRAETGRTFGGNMPSTVAPKPPRPAPEKATDNAQKSTHWIFAIFQAIAELFKGIFP